MLKLGDTGDFEVGDRVRQVLREDGYYAYDGPINHDVETGESDGPLIETLTGTVVAILTDGEPFPIIVHYAEDKVVYEDGQGWPFVAGEIEKVKEEA